MFWRRMRFAGWTCNVRLRDTTNLSMEMGSAEAEHRRERGRGKRRNERAGIGLVGWFCLLGCPKTSIKNALTFHSLHFLASPLFMCVCVPAVCVCYTFTVGALLSEWRRRFQAPLIGNFVSIHTYRQTNRDTHRHTPIVYTHTQTCQVGWAFRYAAWPNDVCNVV